MDRKRGGKEDSRHTPIHNLIRGFYLFTGFLKKGQVCFLLERIPMHNKSTTCGRSQYLVGDKETMHWIADSHGHLFEIL